MKSRDIGRHKPILTALKKAGFKKVEIEEQEKKTVINISFCETNKGGKTTMKSWKKSSIKQSILSVFFIVVSLSACSYWQGDLAKIVISFGGAGRAAYDPEDSETHQKLEYKIALTNEKEMLTFNFEGGTTFEAYVTPGRWNVLVNSYLDGEIYATGSKDVILKVGENNEIIKMYQSFFTEVPGNNLAQKLKWLSKNAVNGGKYKIDVTGTESIGSGNWLGYEDKEVSITLTGGVVNLSDVKNDFMFNIFPNVTLVLENITLKGRSDSHSPLIAVNGILIMNNGAVITGNNNDGASGAQGGGLIVGDGAIFNMSGGKIFGNSAAEWQGGGGVFVGSRGTFNMSGGEIYENTATSGGGVGVHQAAFNMSGGKIYKNTARGAGGVCVTENATFLMTDGEISGNNTTDWDGGGVQINDSIFKMEDGEISGNTATHGGGVSLSCATFTMTGGEISSNTATTWNGGGVNLSGENGKRSIFTMEGGKISGNKADGGGGVCVQENATFTMTGGEISGNTATKYDGGGVTVNYGAAFTKTKGIIYGYPDGEAKSNVVKENGFVRTDNRGHAVFVYGRVGDNIWITLHHRESTADSTITLNSSNNTNWDP